MAAAAHAQTTDAGDLGSAYRAAVAALRGAGVENASLDARLLLAHALGIDAVAVIAAPEREIDAASAAKFDELISRRVTGEPVARILGIKEFWSRTFRLSPQTLVPRPETETVVEAALETISERSSSLRILDLGTGSGILLGALLLELPRATGVAVDLDFDAARMAQENLQALGLGDRAQAICGRWADAISGRFDVIVSNPPYIASDEIGRLDREVREHDPARALDGGADGLDSYRAILGDLPGLLVRGGLAILELGTGQEPAVADLARRAHLRVNGPARCDLSGQPRALTIGPCD